jgi:hypothetical protein
MSVRGLKSDAAKSGRSKLRAQVQMGRPAIPVNIIDPGTHWRAGVAGTRVGELGERSKEVASHGDALKTVEDSFYFPLPISTDKENVLARADKGLPAVISAVDCRDRAIAHHLHDMNIEFVWLRALGSD